LRVQGVERVENSIENQSTRAQVHKAQDITEKYSWNVSFGKLRMEYILKDGIEPAAGMET
jgi:hypothetical protein